VTRDWLKVVFVHMARMREPSSSLWEFHLCWGLRLDNLV
jgi:hypothetical protein